MKKLVIIGGGNMGGAIFKAIYRDLQKRNSLAKDILKLVDVDLKKLQAIQEELAIRDFDDFFSVDLTNTAKNADYLMLAIKPQIFTEFAASLTQEDLRPEVIYISIMAGVTQAKLKDKLQTSKIVRAMPNLPAQISLGVTGFCAAESITPEDLQNIIAILNSFSTPIQLAEESKLDALTAISGSGPAYFFYLTELLEKYAQDQGFSESDARILATKTLIGAAGIIAEGKLTAKEWKQAVTSPGGTTEAALVSLRNANLAAIFTKL